MQRKEFFRRSRRKSQLNTVEEGNAGVITTGRAAEAVVKDPPFPVLKEDPGITRSARHLRSSGLDHKAISPGLEILVEDLITNVKIDVLCIGKRCC